MVRLPLPSPGCGTTLVDLQTAPVAVPRLWPALPPETRRQLARELALLLRLIGAPAPAGGMETSNVDRDACR